MLSHKDLESSVEPVAAHANAIAPHDHLENVLVIANLAIADDTTMMEDPVFLTPGAFIAVRRRVVGNDDPVPWNTSKIDQPVPNRPALPC